MNSLIRTYSDSDRIHGYEITLHPFLDESFCSKINRAYLYTKDNKVETICEIALPILTSTSICAVTGGLIGMVTAGPPGAAAGTIIGAVAGSILGLTTAAYITNKNYERWKRKAIDQRLLPTFLKFYGEDPRLKDFICPLSDEAFRFPMKDIYGHTYEKDLIETWLKQSQTSPLNRQPLKVNDLEPDIDILGKMYAIIEPMIVEEVQNTVGLPEIIAHELTELKQDLQQQRTQIDFLVLEENAKSPMTAEIIT